MSIENINSPSHKFLWPSHHHSVFPTTIWSFPMSIENINGPSHKCLWPSHHHSVIPTTIWSFPISVENINGPSHKCMWPFPSLLGLSHYHLVFPYECKKYQWSFP